MEEERKQKMSKTKCQETIKSNKKKKRKDKERK